MFAPLDELFDTQSVAALFPNIAAEWHWSNNDPPEDYLSSSLAEVKWICKYGHVWTIAINERTEDDQGCPVCFGRIHCSENSLGSYPDAWIYWHPTKNGNNELQDYFEDSEALAWFKCECDPPHDYQIRICDFAKGSRCPYKDTI